MTKYYFITNYETEEEIKNKNNNNGYLFSDIEHVFSFSGVSKYIWEIFPMNVIDKRDKYYEGIYFAKEVSFGEHYSFLDFKTFQMLIEQGAILETYKHNIFNWAISYNDNIVKYMINMGLANNSRDVSRIVALGDLSIIEYMIDNDFGIDELFYHSLHYPNISHIVQHLIDHGVKIDVDDITLACQHSDPQTIKLLIDSVTNINDVIKTALPYAVKSCNLSVVRYMVNIGADISLIDNCIIYKSMKTCKLMNENKFLDILKILIDLNIHLIISKECILESAIKVGLFETVKYLTEIGANIHFDNDKFLTLASEHGREDIFIYLVKSGADIFTIENVLEKAILSSDLKIAKFLIESKMIDHGYNDALAIASCRGYFGLVKCLIAHGADVNGDNGIPIGLAAEKGHLSIVKYLIKMGANIYADYALLCASKNGHINVVKYLIKHGADVNDDDDYALLHASKNGYIDVVKYLIEHGADVNARDGITLPIACTYGHFDIVKILVKAGADIHINNEEPIRNAVEEGYHKIVRYLISKGANIEVNKGYCLRFASCDDNYKIVKFLVEAGADIHVNDDFPIKKAIEYNNAKIINFLRKNGATL